MLSLLSEYNCLTLGPKFRTQDLKINFCSHFSKSLAFTRNVFFVWTGRIYFSPIRFNYWCIFININNWLVVFFNGNFRLKIKFHLGFLAKYGESKMVLGFLAGVFFGDANWKKLPLKDFEEIFFQFLKFYFLKIFLDELRFRPLLSFLYLEVALKVSSFV